MVLDDASPVRSDVVFCHKVRVVFVQTADDVDERLERPRWGFGIVGRGLETCDDGGNDLWFWWHWETMSQYCRYALEVLS